jgi:hypothetical protein
MIEACRKHGTEHCIYMLIGRPARKSSQERCRPRWDERFKMDPIGTGYHVTV